MRSERIDNFGYKENREREIRQLEIEPTPGSKNNKSHHDNAMSTETLQSSREGQKSEQVASEEQPIVCEDKVQSIRNLESSSSDTNGSKGLKELCKSNKEKTSGKAVSFENHSPTAAEQQPIVYENKSKYPIDSISSSDENNRNQGSKEPFKFKTRNTSGVTASFENQSKCDQTVSSVFQFPQKLVEVSKEEKILNSQQLKDSAKGGPKIQEDVVIFKEAENGVVEGNYIHVGESMKESKDTKEQVGLKLMSDSYEASKKNYLNSPTKAYTEKLGVNNETLKGLIKKVSENQFQPVMKMANPANTNDVLKAVTNHSSEEKATELAKNKTYLKHQTDKMIKNSFDINSSLQSVPEEDSKRKITAMNENFTKSVNRACIEDTKKKNSNSEPLRPRCSYPELLQSLPTVDLDSKIIAVNEKSSEKEHMASSVEDKMDRQNSARPRFPQPEFSHTIPEVSSSTAKILVPVPEIPIFKTNETSESIKTKPVEKKSLNSALHLIPSPDSSVPEILSPATKSLIEVHKFPLYGTDGTSKNGKTNTNEEKPINSSLRLIPCILPESSASEISDTEVETELKQINRVPEDLKPAPMVSTPVKNGKSSKRMSEIFSSIPNPFKRRAKSYSPQSKFETAKVETVEEIKNMTELQSQKPSNQSIYKLAYNESITDSSSTHSRSLSPINREKLIPPYTFHDEIVVYEADSDSEPGSEDLELLPHRYDCDTVPNRENNLYINKLSLAVELIRTQEELPYDDQFKRIVEDDPEPNQEVSGEENLGFVAEPPGWNAGNGAGISRNIVVTSPPRRSDKLATTGVTSTAVDILTDSCEEAGRAESPMPINAQNSLEGTRAINRRLRGHMRHYLSSRTFGNPCLCCIVM